MPIRMADLRADGPAQLSQRLRLDPLRHLRALEAACHSIATEERPGYDKDGTLCVAWRGVEQRSAAQSAV